MLDYSHGLSQKDKKELRTMARNNNKGHKSDNTGTGYIYATCTDLRRFK